MNLLMLTNKDETLSSYDDINMNSMSRSRPMKLYPARDRWRKNLTQDNEIVVSLEMIMNWIIGDLN